MSARQHRCPKCDTSWSCDGCADAEVEKLCDDCAQPTTAPQEPTPEEMAARAPLYEGPDRSITADRAKAVDPQPIGFIAAPHAEIRAVAAQVLAEVGDRFQILWKHDSRDWIVYLEHGTVWADLDGEPADTAGLSHAFGAAAVELWTGCAAAERLLAAKRARHAAEVAELRATEQALRDAMFAGHAGHSCKQIGELADWALDGEAKAMAEAAELRASMDVLRDEHRAAMQLQAKLTRERAEAFEAGRNEMRRRWAEAETARLKAAEAHDAGLVRERDEARADAERLRAEAGKDARVYRDIRDACGITVEPIVDGVCRVVGERNLLRAKVETARLLAEVNAASEDATDREREQWSALGLALANEMEAPEAAQKGRDGA